MISFPVFKVTGQWNQAGLPSLFCTYAKTCLMDCIRVKGETSDPNQIPSHQITAINYTPFLRVYQTARSHSPSPLHLFAVTHQQLHSVDMFCNIIPVLCVWREKENGWLCEIYFFIVVVNRIILVFCQFLNCCLTQHIEILWGEDSERRLLQMHLVEDRQRSVDIISVHQAKRVFPVSCIA